MLKKRPIITITIVFGLLNAFVMRVMAGGRPTFEISPIYIPVFVAPDPSFSIFSWIFFIGALASIGAVIFWIYRIIKAAVKALRSEGKSEDLGEAWKEVQGVIISAAMTLAFPVILSLVGAILGIGTIFEWPRMFRECDEGAASDYYFQAFLAVPEGNTDPIGYADGQCFL